MSNRLPVWIVCALFAFSTLVLSSSLQVAPLAAKAKKKKKKRRKKPELDPLPDELKPGAERRYKVRVRPATWEQIRLRPDGFSVGGNAVGRPGRMPKDLVVVEPGELPRVVVVDGPIRVLLYIPAEALHDVITKPVVAMPKPAEAPRGYSGPGVYLMPGAAVKIVSRQRELVRIRLQDDRIDLFGWVPNACVGKMFVPAKGQPSRGDALVRPGTELKTEGAYVGKFRADAESPLGEVAARVTKLQESEKGQVLIEYGSEYYLLRCSVPADAFVSKQTGKRKSTPEPSGEGHGETNPNRVPLPAKTRLYDAEGGSVIGVVMQSNTFFADQRILPGGWLKVRYFSSWGELGMWANVSDKIFAEGTFGQMIKNGKFYWLAKQQGHPVCQEWKVRMTRPKSLEGGIDWSARAKGQKMSAGYRFQYVLGLLVLQGPQARSADVERYGGSFRSMSIMSCGAGCLQVGDLRWYFERKTCEWARKHGLEGTELTEPDIEPVTEPADGDYGTGEVRPEDLIEE